MNRAVSVARMQLINKWTFLGIPAVIMAGSFALTYAIWLIVPNHDGQPLYSGASQAVIWYFLALGIQSLTMTFPFSQAMSVSRRTFFIGTTGLFAVVALVVSVLYYLLGLVEVATDGWGLNGQLYALGWVAESPADSPDPLLLPGDDGPVHDRLLVCHCLQAVAHHGDAGCLGRYCPPADRSVGSDDVAGMVAAGWSLVRGPDAAERQRLDGRVLCRPRRGSYLTLRRATP